LTERPPCRHLKPEFLTKRFHPCITSSTRPRSSSAAAISGAASVRLYRTEGRCLRRLDLRRPDWPAAFIIPAPRPESAAAPDQISEIPEHRSPILAIIAQSATQNGCRSSASGAPAAEPRPKWRSMNPAGEDLPTGLRQLLEPVPMYPVPKPARAPARPQMVA